LLLYIPMPSLMLSVLANCFKCVLSTIIFYLHFILLSYILYYVYDFIVVITFVVIDNDEEEYSNEGYKYYEEDIMHGRVDNDGAAESAGTGQTLLFEEIVASMIDVTADGGVKKQTIVHGIGEVIPPDANVTSNLISYHYEGQSKSSEL